MQASIAPTGRFQMDCSFSGQHCKVLYVCAYPVFWIGKIKIPAPILPATIAAIFLASVYLGVWKSSAVAQDAAFPMDKSEKNSEQVRDEEDITIIESPPQWMPNWVTKVSQWIQMYCWMMLLQLGGHSQHWQLYGTCVLQIASMLGPNTSLKRQVQKNEMLAASGWMVLAVQAYVTARGSMINHWLTSIVLVLGAASTATALPADPITLDTTYSTSAMVVIALAPLIKRDSWILGFRFYGLVMWPYAVLATISTTRNALYKWQTSRGSHALTAGHLRTLIEESLPSPRSAAYALIAPVAVLGTLATSAMFINYLTSCLGLKTLILGLPATRPAFLGSNLISGLLYVVAAIKFSNRRREVVTHANGHVSGVRRMCTTYVEAAGWTNVVIVAVAATIFAVMKAATFYLALQKPC